MPLRREGSHLLRTEAETLEEALLILKRKAAAKKRSATMAGKPMTLRQEIGLSKTATMAKSITLSDRVKVSKFMTNRPAAAVRVVWTKRQVIEAFKTGCFKKAELAVRAKVSVQQILYWVHGTDQPPYDWVCSSCHTRNRSAMDLISRGFQPVCSECHQVWYATLTGEG